LKESIVEIKGHLYRYHYDPNSKKSVYDGPVGSAPELDEEEFLLFIEEEPIYLVVLGKERPVTMADFQQFVHRPNEEVEVDYSVMHNQEIDWKNWPLMEKLEQDMEKEGARIFFERERRRRGKMGEVRYWKDRRSGELITAILLTENLIPNIAKYGIDTGNEVIAHEFGHYIEQKHGLMSEHINEDVLGTYNEERGFYDGIFGMHNSAEAWAEGVSVYYNNPDDLKKLYPDAYDYIDRKLNKLGLGR
jgi:hypothetical protein